MSAGPFETFFDDPVYLELKNQLFSYLRRKDEIQRFVGETRGTMLEIGSGTSPVTIDTGDVIYSDISEGAVRYLRRVSPEARLLVSSATEIPLQSGSVSTVVCSEVLEHIVDDRAALTEIHRVLRLGGKLILTVPIHDYYFAFDDRFVDHKRRYDVPELLDMLRSLGFQRAVTSKVAGPLEKISTMAAVAVFQLARGNGTSKRTSVPGTPMRLLLGVYGLANRILAKVIKLDAKICPQRLSSIILVCCYRRDAAVKE